MKGFKGTHGEWQVVDTYDNYLPWTPDTPQIIVWDGDEQASGPICDMGEIGDMNYAEALANATLIAGSYDLASALKELIFLHGCEQEGIASGQPTRKQWLKAYDDGVNALEKAGIDLSEI